MEQMAREYFEYCEKVNWHFNKISIYCKKNYLSFEKVLKLARTYAYENDIYSEEMLNIKIIHQLVYNDWLTKWINKSKKRLNFYHKLSGGDIYEFKLKLLKECYYYCENVDYEIEKVQKFSNELDMRVSIIYEYVMEYYIYILGNSIESWNKKYEQIKIQKNRKNDEQKVQEFINYSDDSRYLYEKLECTSYSDLVKKLSKFCYEYCESVEFNIDKIREYSKKINISYQTFRNYASEYEENENFKLISNHQPLSDNVKKMGVLKKWVSTSKKRERVYESLGKGSYDQFKNKLIKTCYEYANTVNFNKEKLKEFADMMDVSYTTLMKYIKKYMKNVLELSDEDIFIRLNPTDSNFTDDMRVTKWINNSKKRENLYRELGNLPYENFRIALYKMCYEYGVFVDFDKEKIKILSSRIDITPQVICIYIKKYAIDILKMEESEWKVIRKMKK